MSDVEKLKEALAERSKAITNIDEKLDKAVESVKQSRQELEDESYR